MDLKKELNEAYFNNALSFLRMMDSILRSQNADIHRLREEIQLKEQLSHHHFLYIQASVNQINAWIEEQGDDEFRIRFNVLCNCIGIFPNAGKSEQNG